MLFWLYVTKLCLVIVFCSRLYPTSWASMIGSPPSVWAGGERKSQTQKRLCKVVSIERRDFFFFHGTITSFVSGSQSTLEAL